MIPLKINGKHLCEIFEPNLSISGWSDQDIVQYSAAKQMLPSEVSLTSETYSRDAERTADYELEYLTIVNRKAKPEVTWSYLRADYVESLMQFLDYNYNFKDGTGTISPRPATRIQVDYIDFTGVRTIEAYLGQTIEGTLVEYEGVQYWQNFRLAFPER